MKITATVITHNEEHNIAAALGSLRWADEIVVVDSESDDGTVEIARTFTDHVFVRPWPGYSAQKNFAAEQASNDWIFSLDADERVSPELAGELERLRSAGEPPNAGFKMPRMAFYLGRWIKHSGWYPDFKTRLYDRRRARWRGDYVHETLELDGGTGKLQGALLHYTVRDASEHHLRIDRYTTLAAQQAFAAGEHTSGAALLIAPALTFLRSYVFRLGFLDGWQGLVIARFAAHYAFLKLTKLHELQLKPSADRRD